jgi:hypothetical protein
MASPAGFPVTAPHPVNSGTQKKFSPAVTTSPRVDFWGYAFTGIYPIDRILIRGMGAVQDQYLSRGYFWLTIDFFFSHQKLCMI